MRGKFNSLKLHALSTFENRGWLSPPAWAALASYYPVRASYTYLKRLHRWKLLDLRIPAIVIARSGHGDRPFWAS